VQNAAEEVGRRARILPVPLGLLLCVLMIAGRLGINLRVNADNLIGFLANQKVKHKPV
jgi:hypothetical protein